jgi:hypothetical protein
LFSKKKFRIYKLSPLNCGFIRVSLFTDSSEKTLFIVVGIDGKISTEITNCISQLLLCAKITINKRVGLVYCACTNINVIGIFFTMGVYRRITGEYREIIKSAENAPCRRWNQNTRQPDCLVSAVCGLPAARAKHRSVCESTPGCFRRQCSRALVQYGCGVFRQRLLTGFTNIRNHRVIDILCE